jgi:WD40 repeat protein
MIGNGFYWPTTSTDRTVIKEFLADGCWKLTGRFNYLSLKYHVGADIRAALDSEVKAISAGTVVQYSENGWGTDERDGKPNQALVVRHTLEDNSPFYAVYGHIGTPLRLGQSVEAGDTIGQIRMWRYRLENDEWKRGEDHLHFGIQPGEVFLNANHLGMMDCPSELPLLTNEYVEPISFIENHTPGPVPAVAEITPTQTNPPVATVTPTFVPSFTPAPLAVEDSWIAFVGFDQNVWMIHPDGSSRTQLTFDGIEAVTGQKGNPHTEYRRLAWSPDGSMLGMLRIDENGTRIQAIKMSDLSLVPIVSNMEGSFDWLPDGKSIIYSNVPYEEPQARGDRPGGLSLFEISTGTITPFLDPGPELRLSDPDWSPQGGYVSFRISVAPRPPGIAGSWMGLAKNTGNVFTQVQRNDAACEWNPKEEILACRSGIGEILCSDLVFFSPDGEYLGSITQNGECHQVNSPAWSPDGEWLAFIGNFSGKSDLYLIKKDGSGLVSLSERLSFAISPEWSPDGRTVAFLSGTSWNQDIFLADRDGADAVNISSFPPGVHSFAWQPSSASPGGNMPTPVSPNINLTDPQSIISAFAHGLESGEIEVFNTLFTEDSLLYGSGMAEEGGRVEIPKNEFLAELADRLPSQPACLGYTLGPEGNSLMIWTGGWQPWWEMLGKPSSDVLTFHLFLRDGKVSATAYFTPGPGVLGLSSFHFNPCP